MLNADGPTTEKALHCIIVKWAQDLSLCLLTPHSKTEHLTCSQKGRWAAEVTKDTIERPVQLSAEIRAANVAQCACRR